jgi:hypothetical protein
MASPRELYIYIYITRPEPLPIYRDCRLQRLPPAAKTLASLDRGKLKNPRWFRNQFCKYSSSSWFVRLIPPLFLSRTRLKSRSKLVFRWLSFTASASEGHGLQSCFEIWERLRPGLQTSAFAARLQEILDPSNKGLVKIPTRLVCHRKKSTPPVSP